MTTEPSATDTSSMHHVFRVYTEAKGYALYSGGDRAGLKEEALGMTAGGVSGSFLKLQGRLDAVLGSAEVSLSLAFRQDGPDVPVCAGYGLALVSGGARPQRILFLHAVEVAPEALISTIDGLVRLLAPPVPSRLASDLRAVAAGDLTIGRFLPGLIRQAQAVIAAPADRGDGVPGRRPLRGVEHDCLGAAGLAWNRLSRVAAGCSPPWEVFDAIVEGGRLFTLIESSSPGAGGWPIVKASDLMRGIFDVEPRDAMDMLASAPPGSPHEEGGDDEGGDYVQVPTSPGRVPPRDPWLLAVCLLLGAILVAGGAILQHRIGVLERRIERCEQRRPEPVWPGGRDAFNRRLSEIEDQLAWLLNRTVALKSEGTNERSDSTVIATVASVIGGRSQAIESLVSLWKADEKTLEPALDAAIAKATAQSKVPILKMVQALATLEVDLLRRHDPAVSRFLAQVENNGDQTRTAVKQLRRRMGEPPLH